MTGEYSLADIAAATGNGRNGENDGFGNGNNWWWIILLFLVFGYGRGFGYGNQGGGSSDGGAMAGYVLTSDFANIERKLDGVNNGICNLGYTVLENFDRLNNNTNQGFYGISNALTTQGYENRIATQGVQSQLAQCCCDIREGISGVNYNMATTANGVERQVERGFCDTNFNLANQHCQTLQAIDKVGDRVIDYLANKENQSLRDEVFTYKLAASQQAQNNYLVQQLGQKCPIPAYLTCNPNAPLNYSVSYGGGCGCGNGFSA